MGLAIADVAVFTVIFGNLLDVSPMKMKINGGPLSLIIETKRQAKFGGVLLCEDGS